MDIIGMKDIPENDRPYERCIHFGPESLSDVELLSIIIRTGSVGESSLNLAQKILALNYPEEGILGLLHLSLPELMKMRGIGKVKGVQLLCVGELSKRIWRKEAVREISFHEPATIADYYMEDMRHMEQENLRMMLLNSKHVLIRDILVSRGTVNASIITPRELFIEALRHHAVNIILVHNHPSGDPEPSREDEIMTRRVLEAGKIIGVQVVDHIIIGNRRYVSLRERGMI